MHSQRLLHDIKYELSQSPALIRRTLLFALVLSLAVAVTHLWQSYDALQQQAARQAGQISSQIAERIDATLHSNTVILRDIGDRAVSQSLVMHRQVLPTQFNSLLTQVQQRMIWSSAIADLTLLDERCRAVFSAVSPPGASAADSDYCRWLQRSPSATELYTSAQNVGPSNRQLVQAYKIRDDDGAPIGLAVSFLSPDYLSQELARIDAGANGEVYIVDARSQPLATLPASGQNAPLPKPGRLLGREDNLQLYEGESLRDQQSRLYARSNTVSTPFVVIVGLSPLDYLQPLQQSMLTVGLAWAALATLLLYALKQSYRGEDAIRRFANGSLQVDEDKQQLAQLSDTGEDALLLVDKATLQVLFANHRACEWLQLPLSPSQFDGEQAQVFLHLQPLVNWINTSEKIHRNEINLLFDDGIHRWVSVTLHNTQYHGVDACAVALADISGYHELLQHAKTLRSKLDTFTSSDPLTHALRSGHFVQRVHEEIERSRRYKTPLCVAAVKLANLELYATVHGRSIADALLADVGRQLTENIRPFDKIGRTQEDNFYLLLPNAKQEDARSRLTHLQELLAQSLPPLAENKVILACDALQWQEPEDAETLLRRLLALEQHLAQHIGRQAAGGSGRQPLPNPGAPLHK